jgi:hypothetical protein
LKDNRRSDLIKLLKDIVSMRGPDQIEKDIEEFVRKQTVFVKSSLLPPSWPAPTHRWGHIFNTLNNFKNYLSLSEKTVIALLEQGYGKVALRNIIKDDIDCGDPLRQMHMNDVQTHFALILNQLDEPTKKRLIEQERKVLSTCLSYLFDKREKFCYQDEHFLDKCVTRWKALGMETEALAELDKYQ